LNRQIVKLFAFIVALFAVLVGFTSYWSVFDAKALKEKDANKRPLLEQQQIKRGRILADDGTVIARSVPKGRGSSLRYVRRYPEGDVFGHPIGYSFVEQGDSEFEQFHNDQLVGNESEFSSILDELRGKKQEGDDVVTNIDPEAQRVALAGLAAAGHGAVVAIEPSSGRVRVMASNPTYDPNRVPDELEKLNENKVEAPLVNRAVFARYAPGSTFKVVTAAAALDSGVITPETVITAPGSITDEGLPLENDFNASYTGPLDGALTQSVNTWFAQVGARVGEDTLFEYMERFGFNTTPPLDLPSNQMLASGLVQLPGGKLLTKNDPIDIERVAIGQERLLVTPLQNAMVAAAVANKGHEMKPQIWNKVIDPDGRVVESMDPSEFSQPISEKTAEELTTAMEGVVSEGTGTNAEISGVPVAGKTGTAETPYNESCGGGEEENQAWFMGFAPADEPKVAIAVSIECTPQFGNDVAAPIFREVAETILNEE
jgi:peptidoglycan glycosyltransferase